MAADPAAAVAVLFGGYENVTSCFVATTCPLGDTWFFHDGAWTNITPATPNATNTPSPRWGASMIYDPWVAGFLLFGGTTAVPNGLNSPVLNDTWVLSLSTDGWRQLCGACGPVVRWDAGMVYDTVDSEAVLFGGETSQATATSNLGDSWRFNGTAWNLENSLTSPSARNSPSMAWDAETSTVLLFGGIPASSESWQFVADNWTLLTPGIVPGPRGGAAAATDPLNGSVILYGGCATNPCGSGPMNDTWDYSGGGWHQLRPNASSGPGGSDHAGFVEQSPTAGILLVGGDAAGVPSSQTWSLFQLEAARLSASRSAFDVGQSTILSQSTLGGFAPLTFAWFGLPTGCASVNLSLTSCSPSPPGPYAPVVSVSISDRAGDVVFAPPLTLHIAVWPAVGITPSKTAGVAPLPVSFAAAGTGGTGTLVYNWTFGDRGTALGPAPQHTFTSAGNFSVSVWANDSTGASAHASVYVRVVLTLGLNVAISPATVSAGQQASIVAVAFGGAAPYAFTFEGLPTGCSLVVSGNYSCDTATAGEYHFLVHVTDQSAQTATANATLHVTPAHAVTGGSPPWYRTQSSLTLFVLAGIGFMVIVAAVAWRRRRRSVHPPPVVPVHDPHEVVVPGGTLYLPPPRPEGPEEPEEPE
ncbi:MAG: PKD domain-containing protein [Thermoplasmata archaeon]|nr:PKD domain-containing protein [Thermoplasmata archaeon]